MILRIVPFACYYSYLDRLKELVMKYMIVLGTFYIQTRVAVLSKKNEIWKIILCLPRDLLLIRNDLESKSDDFDLRLTTLSFQT